MKINKILIANRGEIAARVLKTCQQMNIETVCIYADDDANMSYVKAASKAVNIGTGKLSETYLNAEKIIQIARENNCDAIHPGYGLLSENADFAKAISAANLIFIGPSIEAITLMGDKKASKLKAQELGIPLLPGYHGDQQDEKTLLSEATKIGLPLLIKASAGGGGKGMRIVKSLDDFSSALAQSKREALNAFGDDKVLLERYVESPRHIEVQIVSEKNNHLHFYERECSIQRRYQKIIEESPAPKLTEELRHQICETAVKIASGINYLGAGTVEFILDEQEKFYFLEMNTRLQVEHPITEMVTGVDLVKLQIMVAQGEKMGLTQAQIKTHGHALECRIYSEDADQGFLPSTGYITELGRGKSDSRFDCALIAPCFIGGKYDPMLAKIITYAPTRLEAIDKMQQALADYPFLSLKTNRAFLQRVLSHTAFKNADITTHFIAVHEENLKRSLASTDEIALIFSYMQSRSISLSDSLWNKSNDFVSNSEKSFTLMIDGKEYNFIVLKQDHQKTMFQLLGKTYHYYFDDLPKAYLAEYEPSKYHFCDGELECFFEYRRKNRIDFGPKVGRGSLVSPMPGKIFKVLKNEGQAVVKGDELLILEAMKMEHSIRAHSNGIVEKLFFKEGDQVKGGVLLAQIKEEEV